MKIEISNRARKYGYVIWSIRQDEEMLGLLGDLPTVQLYFDGSDRGIKKVDRKTRRISIGYKWTRQIPESKKSFILSLTAPNTLNVTSL